MTDHELDAAQFAGLVVEAREHASAADHAHAVQLLDAALALWRGDALAEFDWARLDADADIARLADLRLVAAEVRAEAMLHLGRGREGARPRVTLITGDRTGCGSRRFSHPSGAR